MATELRVRVEFSDDKSVAILRMQCGDNRVVPDFLRDFNNALDLVEK